MSMQKEGRFLDIFDPFDSVVDDSFDSKLDFASLCFEPFLLSIIILRSLIILRIIISNHG
jgi:hypothetical protein